MVSVLYWSYDTSEASSDYKLLKAIENRGFYQQVILRVPDSRGVWRWRYDKGSYPKMGLISALTPSRSETIAIGEDYDTS